MNAGGGAKSPRQYLSVVNTSACPWDNLSMGVGLPASREDERESAISIRPFRGGVG